MTRAPIFALLLALVPLGLPFAPVLAQETVEDPADGSDDPGQGPEMPAGAQPDQGTARGKVALLRGLDKISGRTTDLTVAVGDAVEFGRLEVRLGDCRTPVDNPDSDAFAQMVVTDKAVNRTVFAGWMIASSPALSAMDDARYDIWVVGCDRR